MDTSTSGRVKSQLEELMESEDEAPMEEDEGNPKPNDAEALLNDDSPLPETDLGQAIDLLITTWAQLLPNIRTRQISQAQTMEHVKEFGEICVRNFRDACHDVNSEFTKIAIQWQHEHPDETNEELLKDINAASTRQSTLLGRVPGVWSRRTDEYFKNSQQK
ncbi:unnamed protein product, partial [Mesorhabditis belari]|uniref:Uncharacterized protein n=1 Tax=Mesorhabditis belari TaxID=2138241 RepID=A0AAF3JA39_9BILA